MLHIALQTLRARWTLFAGSFVALAFGVTLIASTGQVLYATARPQPPVQLGRYDAAAVVVRPDQSEHIVVGSSAAAHTVDQTTTEARRLSAATADRLRGLPGAAQVVVDRTFSLQILTQSGSVNPGQQRLSGHGWSSSALTPFHLHQGNKPIGANEVVLSAGLAARAGVGVGDHVRVVTTTGPHAMTVSGVAAPPGVDGVPGEDSVFFTDDVAAQLSGAADQADAIGVVVATGTSPDALAATVRGALPEPSLLVATGANKGGHVGADSFVSGTNEIAALLGLMAMIAAFVSVFVMASTFARCE